MSTNMAGWVEFKDLLGADWYAGILIDSILIGHYDAYGCLFGVKNYARFRPIAPNRGIPFNASIPVREDESQQGEHSYGHSWITWAEIQAIDWDEQGLDFDQRHPTEYAVRRKILDSEDWIFLFKAMELFAERYGAVRMVVWFYD